LLVNLLNPINTHLHILNLNTLIHLLEPGDLAKSNLVIHFPAILSRMLLAEANLVIRFPTILSWMPLAEANIVIHVPAILSRMPLAEANLVINLPAILSRMPLAEANLVNMLDFIYIEHNIYCNCIHQKNFKLYKCKKEGKSRTYSAYLVTSPNRRSNPGCSFWITRKFLVIIPSSWFYREFIFIHYSYVTFYAYSFPHNNKHTYIMYIFKVSIPMCKCSYDSILLYSYI
jgi:hypothetical protein